MDLGVDTQIHRRSTIKQKSRLSNAAKRANRVKRIARCDGRGKRLVPPILVHFSLS